MENLPKEVTQVVSVEQYAETLELIVLNSGPESIFLNNCLTVAHVYVRDSCHCYYTSPTQARSKYCADSCQNVDVCCKSR